MGSKSVPKPLPTWTFIRCWYLSLLEASWSRLSVVLGEAGVPFLLDPPMVLRDCLNYKLRSSRASGACSKGLLGLILEVFLGAMLGPSWGQDGARLHVDFDIEFRSLLGAILGPTWTQLGAQEAPKPAA